MHAKCHAQLVTKKFYYYLEWTGNVWKKSKAASVTGRTTTNDLYGNVLIGKFCKNSVGPS